MSSNLLISFLRWSKLFNSLPFLLKISILPLGYTTVIALTPSSFTSKNFLPLNFFCEVHNLALIDVKKQELCNFQNYFFLQHY